MPNQIYMSLEQDILILDFMEIIENCFDYFMKDFLWILPLKMNLIGCHYRGNKVERRVEGNQIFWKLGEVYAYFNTQIKHQS